MSYWYVAHYNELLIDLDDYMRPARNGCPYGEAFFRRRLRDAIINGKLDVQEVWLVESATVGHYHAIVRLNYFWPVESQDKPINLMNFESMEQLRNLIWQLQLGSDLYRAKSDLMRFALGIQCPSLLIMPKRIPNFYREPDAICSCVKKHITSEMMEIPKEKRCAIWNQFRGMTPWELFGKNSNVDGRPEKFMRPILGKVPMDAILSQVFENEIFEDKPCRKTKRKK